jgi:4-hydroxy-4-methyl-2-oxoglutarate aldolase
MAELSAVSDLLPRLAALDSCACSDAMDQLAIAGVAHGLRGLTVSRRVTGSVITVQLGPPEAASQSSRHLGTAAIEAARPGDVIVVAAGGRVDAAGWGGVLSVAATVRGVGGVIVDGACRDVDECVVLDLPVYALAAVPATARGRQREVAWNTPVQISGVSVAPGDLVVADGSGVLFLPAGQAGAIVAAAERVAARESAMVSRLRAGEPASLVLSADYEQMLAARTEDP